jgi:hypothetical protein
MESLSVDESTSTGVRGSSRVLGVGVLQFIVFAGVINLITSWVLDQLTRAIKALSEFFSWFITKTINLMLFFPAPGNLVVEGETVLNTVYWGVSFPLFFGLLSVVIATFFLMMQLDAGSEETNLDSFMQRIFIAVVLVIAVGAGAFIPESADIPQMGLFGYGVEFTNVIGQYLFPDTYQIRVDLETARGIATTGLTGFAVVVFPIIASPKIFLTYGTFLAALGLRAVIVYTTYALFPILIVFWVGETGPLKYGKMIGSLMMKVTVMLLLMGVLISGILGVGAEVAGETGQELVDPSAENVDIPDKSKATEGSRLEGGILDDKSVSFTTERGVMTEAWVNVFIFFGSIWLCVTLVGMTLGGFLSTGFGKQMARAEKGVSAANKVKSGLKDSKRLSGDKDTLGDRVKDRVDEAIGKSKEKAGWTEENANSDSFASKPENSSIADDMRDVVGNVKATTDSAKEKASEVKESTKESVEETVDSAKETGGKVKEKGEKVKEGVEEAADNIDEGLNKAGDKFENVSADKGRELGGKLGSVAGGASGAVGSTLGAAGGKAVGKAGNIAASTTGKMGKYGTKLGTKGASGSVGMAKKAPNLGYRGGKAYWSVFKQPDMNSSMGEVGRIAKESPIGHPGDKDGDAPSPEEVTDESSEDGDDDGRKYRDDEDVGDYDVGGHYQSASADVNDGQREPGDASEAYGGETVDDDLDSSDYETGSHYKTRGGEPDWTDSYGGMESRGHTTPNSDDVNETGDVGGRRPSDFKR